MVVGGATCGDYIQVVYLGELSCAKQFIVCTGLSFNLRNNVQRS